MATLQPINVRNLTCPICQEIFKQPTLLSCSHTFCKACLQWVLDTQINQQKLKCPVCKKDTQVPDGNLGKLQANRAVLSLLKEMAARGVTCMNCDPNLRTPAISYCLHCNENLCASCHRIHSGWKGFAHHQTVDIKAVMKGKMSLKRRRKCLKHPGADEELFCTECRRYVCAKCGVTEHARMGRQVIEKVALEEQLQEKVNALKHQADLKKKYLEERIEMIEMKQVTVKKMMECVCDSIHKTYDEYIQQLTERRDVLKHDLSQLFEQIEADLQTMVAEKRKMISQVDGVTSLLGRSMNLSLPFEEEPLYARETLCENIEDLVKRKDNDDHHLMVLIERAQGIAFSKNICRNELKLGRLIVSPSKWGLNTEVNLLHDHNMNYVSAKANERILPREGNRRRVHIHLPEDGLQ
ncbi:E3 ubiquitin-protein ligase TRIM45-like [Diadema antillarum]|uniref:E3 ubiquitin-protein ligase TRIM45-like n=1 Tax=Diadema antillarum TaxID=105358 RepID=UPI003A89D833